jgi:putative transposase
MSNLDFKGEYKRHLPHIQPPGATFFITTRLAGSMPQAVLARIAREAEAIYQKHSADPEWAELESERYRFREYERHLHEARNGPYWLQERQVAAILAEALHYNDQRLYRLDAFCIMPNHLHLVMMPLPTTPVPADACLVEDGEGNRGYLEGTVPGQRKFIQTEYYSLAKIPHRLKRRSAREGNKFLGRMGDFWEHESYDHWIRDGAEWQRTVAYVRNNPVSASLVKSWEEWPWTYVRGDTP